MFPKRLVKVPFVEKRFVEVALVEVESVKIAVEAEVAPIVVLFIVPPEMVKLSATLASAKVPVHVGVKVWVFPDEVIVRPMFVSDEVANV